MLFLCKNEEFNSNVRVADVGGEKHLFFLKEAACKKSSGPAANESGVGGRREPL